jgi:hypothetical protein
VLAQGGDGDEPARECRYDHRAPLPADIPRSIDDIEAGARRVLRRDAHDPGSAFGKVLGGSDYAVDENGYIAGGEHGWHGRASKVIGATLDVRIITPHGFEAMLPQWAAPWPRSSPNHRYSRHYGYVPYRAAAGSRDGVSGVMVDVDMRTRRVIGITEGVSGGGFDSWRVLPGHCPLPPEPAED